MLVALTVERYLAVCRLGRTRAFAAHKTPLVAVGLALLAISLYLPYLFRAHVITCTSIPDGLPVYRKRENPSFAHSTLWAVYLWILEVIFKVRNTHSIIFILAAISLETGRLTACLLFSLSQMIKFWQTAPSLSSC